MTERCECCGQLLPIRGLPGGVHLSPLKRRIWEAVSSWPGMTAQEIMDSVYGNDVSGGPEDDNNIRINICQMNKQLRGHGVEIRGSKTEGYRILRRANDLVAG